MSIIVIASVQYDLVNVSFNIASVPSQVYLIDNVSNTQYVPNVSFILNFSSLNITITKNYFYFLLNQTIYTSSYYTNITVFITFTNVTSLFQIYEDYSNVVLARYVISLKSSPSDCYLYNFETKNVFIGKSGNITNLTVNEAVKLLTANNPLKGEYRVWVIFEVVPGTVPPQTPNVLPALKIDNITINVEFVK
uniref:Uncharacterized protein n=2 Tax=Acidianus TaxID=12914 RepID=A0A2U9IJP7_9CREN